MYVDSIRKRLRTIKIPRRKQWGIEPQVMKKTQVRRNYMEASTVVTHVKSPLKPVFAEIQGNLPQSLAFTVASIYLVEFAL